MKGWTTRLTICSALLAAAAGAFAQEPPRPPGPPPGVSGPPSNQPSAPAANAPLPVVPPRGGDQVTGRPAGWPERMSPDERRQLRRDINEHGRELYRERRGPRDRAG